MYASNMKLSCYRKAYLFGNTQDYKNSLKLLKESSASVQSKMSSK